MRLLVCLAAVLAAAVGTRAGEPFRDLSVTSAGGEYPRTSFMSFPDAASAASGSFEDSPYYMCLNGIWDFHYTDDVRSIPEGFGGLDWDSIRVPGNWERQGFGTALYTNHQYEFCTWNPQPPVLPEAVPAGVYRRYFTVPESWEGRDVFLHLAGAKSGVYVYVNGKALGYSEDSKNPAEYLLDSVLVDGENELVVLATRWSTGSFLECQDFWRISGIERDVYLFSQPRTAIRDFRVKSSLTDDMQDGVFVLEADLSNRSGSRVPAVFGYALTDRRGGDVVLEGEVPAELVCGKDTRVRAEAVIPSVGRWSAEDPHLYRLVMTLSVGGKVVEAVPFNVGFRRIELRGNTLLVNGRAVKFKGVNVHEHDQVTGHYVSPQVLEADFRLLKKNNFNAVRLSHYPQGRRFYELADEYGIYVYDEANIESHGMYYDLRRGGTLGNDPAWLDAHLYRIRNMYERNKNYPCVTFWSLGNEAGNGYNFYQAYLWLKAADSAWTARPVNYERAQWEWNTDMYVPQYPDASWLEKVGSRGSDRPVMPSEYSHAMGNSNGGLAKQWDAIYRYDNLQGGFIWDWIDQGFLETDSLGRKYWAYGGDYGGIYAPSDGNFCCNGIIGPDRREHPAMAEIRYLFQDVSFAPGNVPGEVLVGNRMYFTALGEDCLLRASLLRDGDTVGVRTFPVELAPQETVSVRPFAPEDMAASGQGEYFVNMDMVRRGGVIARGQIYLGGERLCVNPSEEGPRLSVRRGGSLVEAVSDRVRFAVDRRDGSVVSYEVDGEEMFCGGFGLRPNFWRGPVDNDYGWGMPALSQVWKHALEGTPRVEAQREGDAVRISVSYVLAAGNTFETDYTVMPSGQVKADVVFGAAGEDVPDVPRIGLRFRLGSDKDMVRWYGRGPGENYADRKAGSFVGVYEMSVDSLGYDYVRPQENGHRCDVRELSLWNASGAGLKIVSAEPFGFNAARNCVEDFDCQEYEDRPYQWRNLTPQDSLHDEAAARNVLRRQVHVNDVPVRDYVEVCIDMEHMGVGGYDSWGARPDEEFMIPADRRRVWSFVMVPLASGSR